MISLDAIDEEILNLEKRDTSYATVERLAWLYIVKDHLNGAEVATAEAMALSSPTSDFLQAVDGAPADKVFKILDEHIEAVRLIFPREYNKLMDSLKALKE